MLTMNTEMKKNLLKIINNFGIDNQLKKFNEESYEFIEAVRDRDLNITDYSSFSEKFIEKLKEEKQKDQIHLIEEMADVLVILNQFKEYFDISDKDIEEMMKSKIQRTLGRIEEGYYE